jgi:hypothetical protein
MLAVMRAEEGRERACVRVDTLRRVRRSWKVCSWDEALLNGKRAGDCKIARLNGTGPLSPP